MPGALFICKYGNPKSLMVEPTSKANAFQLLIQETQKENQLLKDRSDRLAKHLSELKSRNTSQKAQILALEQTTRICRLPVATKCTETQPITNPVGSRSLSESEKPYLKDQDS